VISDPALIEARIRSLVSQRAPAIFRGATGTLHGNAIPLLTDGAFPLQVAFRGAAPEAPFELELLGYNSLYRFSVSRALRMGDRVAVPLPERLVRLQHRKSRRAEAPPGFSVSFNHPVLPELFVHRAIRDVSRNGLCFETRVEQDMVCAGLRLRDVTVTTPTGNTLRFDAEVRIVFPPRDGRGPGCGVRLTPATELDASRWNQVVGGVLNPTTRLGATWSEDSWDLYASSGYFSLSGKSGPHFATLKARFASVTRKLDAAPGIGCQVVWPSERGIEASLSLLKVYQHTWFGYQMAKLPGTPSNATTGRQVLRDIHLRAYEHAQADPNLRWTMALVQSSARWSKLVHFDLPQRYTDSGMAAVLDFHAFELEIPDRLPAPGDTAALGTASLAEVGQVLEALQWRRPWVYREALDLVPERFDLAEVRGGWSAAGLHRERALLVTRQGGRVTAAALLEAADPGLHLFNLLDVTRLYAITPSGGNAFSALLEAAAAWYRERGRTVFTCLLEEGSIPNSGRLSPRDLGRGSLTLLSTELLPSFLEHVTEVTAPRLPRN
jgi:hypothetical protein